MRFFLIYSQASQTPLTDCFILMGSSKGNLEKTYSSINYFFIVNVSQKFNYSHSKL